MPEPYAGRPARTVLRGPGEQKCSPGYPTLVHKLSNVNGVTMGLYGSVRRLLNTVSQANSAGTALQDGTRERVPLVAPYILDKRTCSSD